MQQEHKREGKKGVGMTQIWRNTAGDNIRLRREKLGWTQEYLLKRLRESSGEEFYKGKESISMIEKGQVAPPWDKMLYISRLLGMTIDDLAGLCPPSPPAAAAPQQVQNIHGDAYTDSVIFGGVMPDRIAQQVYDRLRQHGIHLHCTLCGERLEAKGEEGHPGSVGEEG